MNILVVIPFENFIYKIIDILKEVYSGEEKICYVTLNKPYKALTSIMQERGFPLDRVIIIDAITKTVIKQPAVTRNCIFISSPIAYPELATAIESVMTTQKIGAIIFDSISTLMIFESEQNTVNYARQIIDWAAMYKCESLMAFLKEDSNKDIMQHLSALVDKVISLEE